MPVAVVLEPMCFLTTTLARLVLKLLIWIGRLVRIIVIASRIIIQLIGLGALSSLRSGVTAPKKRRESSEVGAGTLISLGVLTQLIRLATSQN